MSALHTGGKGRIRRTAPAIALVTGAWLATAIVAPAAAPDTLPGGRSAKVVPIGTYAVGRVEETFVDDSRPTKAHADFPGAPSRTLHTTIYYPARGAPGDAVTADATPDRRHGPYPMVLYSHGNNSFGAEYEALLRQWASAGYVIAAPDYPLSNENGPGDADPSDVENQPADSHFVINRMLASNAKRSGTLSHLVDHKGIGASGHPPDYYSGISTPLMPEHGDADATIPYQSEADNYAKAGPPKYFLTLIGGAHSPPYRGGGDPIPTAVAHVTLDFFDRYLKHDEGALDRLRQDANQSGVATLQEQTR